jgi:hypothetical protein
VRQRSPAFDRVAQQLVEQAVAGRSEADQVSRALDESFERLERALATMVGELGFRALFVRAVHLTRKAEPELPPSVAVSADGSRLGWSECVERLGTEAATRCGALLCANVLVLLASFIGDDLTFRMIRRAFHDFEDAGYAGDQGHE